MRPPKDQVPFSIRMAKGTAEKLKDFSELTGITKTRVVEMAVEKFIAEFDTAQFEDRK